ncbi:winged helix-turn-helix domain-containing protein [Pseudomonas sp. RT6P73]
MSAIETISGTPCTITQPRRVFRLHSTDHCAQFFLLERLLVVSDGHAVTRHELNFSTARILELLLESPGEIVHREAIFAFAWPGRVVGQNSLNQAISGLREVLNDSEHRAIIQTLPRRGYRFNAFYLQPDETELNVGIAKAGQKNAHGNASALGMGVRRVNKLSLTRSMIVFRYGRLLLASTVFIMLMALMWRIDWELLTPSGMFGVEEAVGSFNVRHKPEDAL